MVCDRLKCGRTAYSHTPTRSRLLLPVWRKTTLKPNPNIDWDAWIADYSRVRDAIERTYPDQFKDFNQRMRFAAQDWHSQDHVWRSFSTIPRDFGHNANIAAHVRGLASSRTIFVTKSTHKKYLSPARIAATRRNQHS